LRFPGNLFSGLHPRNFVSKPSSLQIDPFSVFLGAISDCNAGFPQWCALAQTLQHQQEKEIVYMGKLLSPSPVRKKINHLVGSDEGKIALRSLDRDLRLPLRNFFYYRRN